VAETFYTMTLEKPRALANPENLAGMVRFGINPQCNPLSLYDIAKL